MAIDFPASPTLNDTFSSGGVTYTWDGTVWVASGSAAFVQKSGDTITGNLTLNADLTVDTDTLYADSTNNNVGVGTTSPGSYNGSANQLVVSNSADDCGITINSDAASTGNIFFADGTSGSAVAEGYVKYNHSVNNLRFGANGSERMRIDSTGNVGIGTTSPNNGLHILDSASVQLRLESTGTNSRISFKASGTTAVPTIGAQDNDLQIRTGNAESMRIDSAGNVGIGETSPAVALDVAGEVRASTGVLFGTDTAAANTLDDYEEGSWTPVIQGGSTAGSYTGSASGTYTKIGNQVTLRWMAGPITESSAGSGNFLVGGIPFTLSGDDCYGVIHASTINFGDNAMYVICRITTGNRNVIQLREIKDNLAPSGASITDINSGSSYLHGQIVYFVA